MFEYRDLDITHADGYVAYARYWPGPSGAPAVLHLHGIQSHCGWYTETCQAINAAGFSVLQVDRRGSGRNQEQRGHAESTRQLIDDGLQCARELARLARVDRVHLIGVSWGGKLTAAMHASDATVAASLTLVAPGLFPIVDVSSAEKFRIGWSMVADPHKAYAIPLNDGRLFTDNPERIRFIDTDPLTLRAATAGFYLASRRMDKVWRKLNEAPAVPAHLVLAGDEHIIDNARTSDFVRRLPWPTRRVTVYEESRHTIEYGADRAQFLEDLIDFLRQAS